MVYFDCTNGERARIQCCLLNNGHILYYNNNNPFSKEHEHDDHLKHKLMVKTVLIDENNGVLKTAIEDIIAGRRDNGCRVNCYNLEVEL